MLTVKTSPSEPHLILRQLDAAAQVHMLIAAQ